MFPYNIDTLMKRILDKDFRKMLNLDPDANQTQQKLDRDPNFFKPNFLEPDLDPSRTATQKTATRKTKNPKPAKPKTRKSATHKTNLLE